MKTKDFTEKVEALGYEVSYNWGTLYIKRNGFAILDLGYVENWEIDTDYPGFGEMLWNDKKELMTIVSEYMLTDPIDREEEKRYWLKFNAPPLLKNLIPSGYLNIYRNSYEVSLSSDKEDTGYFKAIFTESEIAQMDITGFEKIEVTVC